MAPKTKTLTFEFKMGFTELLTILFIALKITGQITWPWLLVLSPTLIGLAIVLTMIVVGVILGGR